MDALQQVAHQPSRTVIGLMSGTSVDGIDAALVRIAGDGARPGLEVVGFTTVPMADELRAAVHAGFDTDTRSLCELGFALGEAFAAAAIEVCTITGTDPSQVDLIGSHGQTVHHIPRSGPGRPSTMQLGEPAVIAERTGIPVVSDFRTRDMAAGGEGAPLVPYLDWCLFGRPGGRTALQNIGGIANLTVVTQHLDDLMAFDTGPGNMIIDTVTELITDRAGAIDTDGALSASGRVDAELLARLMAHPYLAADPPKTTGRELFGRAFAAELTADRTADVDLLATVVAFTADSIADAYRRFVLPSGPIDEVVVSGGGVHNATVMDRLTTALDPVPVRPLTEVDPDAKEAVAFALLADLTLRGLPGNVPAATGARRPVVLGTITPA